MRVTFIINVKETNIPHTVTNSSVYALSSRNTLFGFHKRIRKEQLDASCTKTNLLLFSNSQDAIDVAQIMEKTQKQISRFTRDIDFINRKSAILDNIDESYRLEYSKEQQEQSEQSEQLEQQDESMNQEKEDIETVTNISNRGPINIEMIPYNYIEKLCALHYFDMLIVYEKTITEIAKNRYELDLDCYEFITRSLPNRSIQENMFRDLLY